MSHRLSGGSRTQCGHPIAAAARRATISARNKYSIAADKRGLDNRVGISGDQFSHYLAEPKEVVFRAADHPDSDFREIRLALRALRATLT
jgi:hypothetical protein